MSDSKQIYVKVQASQTVRYNQIVRMTQADFDMIRKGAKADDGVWIEWLSSHLDLSQVFDADPMDANDISAVICNEEGKAIKPCVEI